MPEGRPFRLYRQRDSMQCGVEKGGRRFRIADPAKGKIRMSAEELESHWASTSKNGEPTEIAMVFDPGEDFGGGCPRRRGTDGRSAFCSAS